MRKSAKKQTLREKTSLYKRKNHKKAVLRTNQEKERIPGVRDCNHGEELVIQKPIKRNIKNYDNFQDL